MFKLSFLSVGSEPDDTNLYSPAQGNCLDITACPDATFSKKILGDGFMVIPETNMICSPCDGTVENIFPTLHAFGIRMKNEAEVMIHIGLETVKLNGNGFRTFVQKGDTVKAGEPLAEFDAAFMKEKQIDMSTMVVLLGTAEAPHTKLNLNKHVNIKDMVIRID